MDRLLKFFTRRRHAGEKSDASHRLLEEEYPAVMTNPRSSVLWKAYTALLHILLLLSVGIIWLHPNAMHKPSWCESAPNSKACPIIRL